MIFFKRYIEREAEKLFKAKLEAFAKEEIEKQKDQSSKIVRGFIFQGVQYFKFEDPFNTPCFRSHAALTFYNELEMKCSKEFLEKHCEAVEAVLNSKDPKFTELAELTNILKERLVMILEPDIIYKIAAVVYFDASENPTNFDWKYNAKKIEKWKEASIEDFFLQQPIRGLMPFSDISDGDLATFITVMRVMTKNHIDRVSTIASEKMKKKGLS